MKTINSISGLVSCLDFNLLKCHRILAGLVLAASLITGGTKLFAQGFTVTITVNENGTGTLVNSNGFNAPLPSALLPDPGPGGLPAALTYGLLNAPGLVAGDLILLEPPNSLVSDIIRFNPNQNGGSLVFYSDITDGALDLADTGFPLSLYANTITFTELGVEGANGFTYTPLANQPGFVAGSAGPVTYVILSDVPEPSTLALAAFGLIGLAAWGWRRLKRSCA
jgi:hypothetical protein